MADVAQKFISLKGGDARRKRYVVELHLVNKRFAPRVDATIRNLSVQGAFLATAPELIGRIIDVEFAFPGQKSPFHVTARVIWSEKAGMGVRFLRFLRGTQEDLEHALSAWAALQTPQPPILQSVPEPFPNAAEILDDLDFLASLRGL